MHRVQEPELRYGQEQKEDAGPARIQEVLQKVQESYSSQRDKVAIYYLLFAIFDLLFSFLMFVLAVSEITNNE